MYYENVMYYEIGNGFHEFVAASGKNALQMYNVTAVRSTTYTLKYWAIHAGLVSVHLTWTNNVTQKPSNQCIICASTLYQVWLTFSFSLTVTAAVEAPKSGSTGRQTTTFVCMTKINHWGVGVTKLRDYIVGSACDSHTAPFSKTAAINTRTHNKLPKCV